MRSWAFKYWLAYEQFHQDPCYCLIFYTINLDATGPAAIVFWKSGILQTLFILKSVYRCWAFLGVWFWSNLHWCSIVLCAGTLLGTDCFSSCGLFREALDYSFRALSYITNVKLSPEMIMLFATKRWVSSSQLGNRRHVKNSIPNFLGALD